MKRGWRFRVLIERGLVVIQTGVFAMQVERGYLYVRVGSREFERITENGL